ncbi:Protein FORGETTER 1, partial [Geodia barretti]
MCMKVPAIVEEIKKALSQDMCVVIGLQTTGESSLESEMEANKGEPDGFVSICREILQRFVRDHFPTTTTLTDTPQVT